MNNHEFKTVFWKRMGYENNIYRLMYNKKYDEFWIDYKVINDEIWFNVGMYKRLANAIKSAKDLGFTEI